MRQAAWTPGRDIIKFVDTHIEEPSASVPSHPASDHPEEGDSAWNTQDPNALLSGADEESSPEEDVGVIVIRRSHFYAALIPLAFILGLSVGFLFWGRGGDALPVAASVAPESAAISSSSAAQSNSAAEPAAPADQSDLIRYDIPVDDDPTLGPENAPITIIEFSDFECPFCRKFHQETFDQILQTYPEQIRFVYRDFPLVSIHTNAVSAAEAANRAGDQDVYWDYHDRLFSMEYGLGRDAYIRYATDLGLDLGTFEQCLDNRTYAEEVQADFNFAARLGVRSTPTFFINGIALVGAQPFEVFQQLIDQELAGELP